MKCEYCNKEISPEAPTCPACGHPNRVASRSVATPSNRILSSLPRRPPDEKHAIIASVISLVGCLGLVGLAISAAYAGVRGRGAGDAMYAGGMLFIYIPVLSVPAFIAALVAIVISSKSLGYHRTPRAKKILSLAIAAPILLLVSYFICLAIALGGSGI